MTNETTTFDLEKENINGLFSNLTLLSMVLTSLASNRKPLKPKQTFKQEYDYVIVGAGSAGAVMANRLSEHSCVSVLLLEAGGEPPLLTEVPGFAKMFLNSEIDWAYRSAPQKCAAFAHKNNTVILNNGKALGGSSSLNAMLYVRGNKRNYDDWAKNGAYGWSYHDVFPYFLKLEDNRNIDELGEDYHRKGGPLTVEKINYMPEIKNPILEATADMGYEQRDINGKRQTGVCRVQMTVRNQQRCSTAKAYLEPARDRPNLDILTHAYARKILIRQRLGINVSYGVEFDHLGKTRTVRAKREVILSNGAIKTPQLLMLSGIGPRKHLRKLNISVVADLPVGKNLQDHYATVLVYTINRTIPSSPQKISNPANILDYTANRKGPLTAPFGVAALAFLNGLNTSRYSKDFPRQQLYFSELNTLDIKFVFNLKDEIYEQVFEPYNSLPSYACLPSLLQPYSRGEITLNSKDPYDMPIIDPRYYEDERDLRDVVEGMKICNAIAKHPAMREVQAELIKTQRSGFPNCETFEEDEDKYLGCLAKNVVNTFWHFSGTVKMGNPLDLRSVVDPKLRVIGVKHLRVVSAAVMPIIPSGNTNVPTIMIAERVYGLMKSNIKCKDKHQEQSRKR